MLFGGSGIYYLSSPVEEEQVKQQQVEIKAGMSSNQVAATLAEAGLIREPLLFRAAVRIRGVEHRLQSGYYDFNTAMSLNEIIDSMVMGRVFKQQFTIPEGATVESIAQRIATQTDVEAEDFLTAAERLSQDFKLLQDYDLSQRKYPLEGYLFPDTYRVVRGVSSDKLVEVMLRQFMAKLDGELWAQIEESEYKVDEIINIASLIEGEAKYDQERELIAGVIYNRLEKGMRLQLDATVQYALSERKDRILYRDLEIESPYNTYRVAGLPPGPINNPGLASIKAALNPAETDYLYYFALEDGSHKFSKSYQEHLRLQNELRYSD